MLRTIKGGLPWCSLCQAAVLSGLAPRIARPAFAAAFHGWSALFTSEKGDKDEHVAGIKDGFLSLEKAQRAATWQDIDKAKHLTVSELQDAFTLPLLREYALHNRLKRSGAKKDLIHRIRTFWGQEDVSLLQRRNGPSSFPFPDTD